MMASNPAPARKLLSVIGPHSGCGKSTFVLHLVQCIPGLGCLKVSPKHDEHAPLSTNGPDEPAGDVDFYLESDERLRRHDRDTGRYLAAGAAQVERLRHRGAGLAAGLEAAWRRYPPVMPVIVESSSALRFISPRAVILVVRPPLLEMKPATADLLDRVTDLLINLSDNEVDADAEAANLRRAFPTLDPRYTWATNLHTSPPPPRLLARVRSLLGIFDS